MSKELTTIDPNELDALDALSQEGTYNHLPRGATMIKFNGQTGRWVAPKVDPMEDLTGKLQLIADPMNSYHGFTVFENNRPICGGRYIVQVPGRYTPRSEIGHQDQSKWQPGLDGKPKDPATFGMYLPMAVQTGDQLYIYITQSTSGINAIKNLLGAYSGNMRRSGRREFPIINLSRQSFRSRFGSQLFAPVLEILGWHEDGAPPIQVLAEPEVLSPEPAKVETKKPEPMRSKAEAEWNDEVPFAPEVR